MVVTRDSGPMADGEAPPPGVRRATRWRSPLRGLWLTSVLGSVLLVALPVVTITGLAVLHRVRTAVRQAIPGDVGWLTLPTFDWPTDPSWLYRLNQGLHVGLGLVLIPIVLAKLWSVIPRLFAWPPARSIAQLLERVSLLMLVGGILFEIVTGVLNIQYDYIFGFSFYTAHYYGAWVFIAGFAIHIAFKIPRMWAGLRSMSMRNVLHTNTKDTRPEPYEPDGLVRCRARTRDDQPPRALALVGGGALFVAVITAGQTIGGWTRQTALLLPRGLSRGDGPNDFAVNRTAAAAQITPDLIGKRWRLTLTGGTRTDTCSTAPCWPHCLSTPPACRSPASKVGRPPRRGPACRCGTWPGWRGYRSWKSAFVRSVERRGAFNRATLQANQVSHPDSLLALRVNDAELSPDHGYPARIIVPAMPGVHNTKWVGSIDFRTK